LTAFVEESEVELVADPVVMKQAMMDEVEEKALTLARNMACKLLSGAVVTPGIKTDCH